MDVGKVAGDGRAELVADAGVEGFLDADGQVLRFSPRLLAGLIRNFFRRHALRVENFSISMPYTRNP